jgi:hypothetical protein
VGQAVDVSQIDSYSDFSSFTGTRQGLYVKGTSDAWFDCYIYRDAFTPILAECPANQYGTSRGPLSQGIRTLDNIHNNDWSLYAGVEFGNGEYYPTPDSVKFTASSATSGGTIEVWLDSLETGEKVAECPVRNTGDLKTFQTFASAVIPVAGRHDVYLKFVGADTGKLFQLQWLVFTVQGGTHSSAPKTSDSAVPQSSGLEQNYPNPFNPSTLIRFKVPNPSFVSLKVYNLLGEEIDELAGKDFFAGVYSMTFNASRLASGPYVYTLRANDFVQSKKMFVLK